MRWMWPVSRGVADAAFMQFVERVGADEAATLARALAELETPLSLGKAVGASSR